MEQAIASADALFSMEGIPEGAVVPEPEGEAATEAAVERLGSGSRDWTVKYGTR
ncbi:hypothetical protein OG279_38030 (plasmid) [Streptomyces sp. NBC_01201]|uniref:hypothetical protein n=1 Tax=Streptomyces sp. NBC_01201 TaxID=2903770 RepID=UPI002E103D6D|nr:hypothetical protein OG279_38030 [Streptomyces sp. NBC_01201]